MPGYSGKPLATKLGIRADEPWYVWDAPDEYETWLGELPAGGTVVKNRLPAKARGVHVFVTTRKKLEAQLDKVRAKIAPDGMLWVSWPKKSAKVETDVTEDVIREVALSSDWVDVKVCAVSEIWSGLKLVIRKEKRT